MTDKLTETTSFDVRISLFLENDNKKYLLPISFPSDYSVLFRNIEHFIDKADNDSAIKPDVQIRKIDNKEVPFNEINLEKINGEEREIYNQWLCLKNNVHCYVKTDLQMIVKNEFYLSDLTPGLMYTVECGLYNPSTGKYYNKERDDIDIKSWTFVAKSSEQKIEGAHKESGILALGKLDFDITDKFTKTSDFEVHISLVLENDDRRCSLPIVCDSSVAEAIKKIRFGGFDFL